MISTIRFFDIIVQYSQIQLTLIANVQSRGCINLLCYRTTFHISGVGVLALLCVIIILALLARDRVCLFIGRAGGQITFQKTKGFGFLILPGLEYCSQYDQIVQEGARALTFGITILVVTAYVLKREKAFRTLSSQCKSKLINNILNGFSVTMKIFLKNLLLLLAVGPLTASGILKTQLQDETRRQG